MRISVKLLWISEAVLLVAVLALLLPLLVRMKNQVVRQMQLELRSIAVNAAPLIDGDLHEKIAAGGAERDAAFETLREQLNDIRRRNPDAETGEPFPYEHMYTFYRDGDLVRFAVMAHPAPFVGDPYELRPDMVDVLEAGEPKETELYTDEHGQWISAYAPIRNSAGAVVGLFAADKSSTQYFMALRDVTWLAVGIGFVVLVLSSLVGWHVLNAIVIGPMKKIRAGVHALGERNFSHRVNLRTRDEFQSLGETLNSISTQLDAAKVVQASFFPKSLPQPDGYCIAGVSIPCDATGGDYFDAFTMDADRVAILLADVSGHGLGPSLLMATCRSAIRALGGTNLEPSALVDRVNRLLLDDLTDGRFITMIFGVLSADGTFTYANAGHGPAIVAHDGRVIHLESHRPPLGIEIDLGDDEQQTSIRLKTHDRILFASDGLSEGMSAAGAYFGVEPIERAMAERRLDCHEVVDRLRQELIAHCAGPSRTDDVTILCVDRVARGKNRPGEPT